MKKKKIVPGCGPVREMLSLPLGPGLALVWMGYGFEAGKLEALEGQF